MSALCVAAASELLSVPEKLLRITCSLTHTHTQKFQKRLDMVQMILTNFYLFEF